jgi:hypothetical protein
MEEFILNNTSLETFFGILANRNTDALDEREMLDPRPLGRMRDTFE